MNGKPVIVFDFFGVVCCEVFDIWLDRHNLWEKRLVVSEVMNYADLGEISLKEECELVGRVSGQTAEEVVREWREIAKINQSLVDFIKKNQEKYRFALLSNSNAEFVRPILREKQLVGLFEKIILSSEVRKVKPNKDVFELVAREMGVEIGRCMMIDDRKINVEGAEKAGMSGLVYDKFIGERGK